MTRCASSNFAFDPRNRSSEIERKVGLYNSVFSIEMKITETNYSGNLRYSELNIASKHITDNSSSNTATNSWGNLRSRIAVHIWTQCMGKKG